ncbi:zinc-dependent alcohol dehydrogenase family protein [Flavobacterium artemisiae]|uniref:Zinc-dependent alcohol dehydrogenase family protein n=1 Tax=Flavobacterium artemisiae TaxID=2126556 RepID=A0ABW4HIQ1_9FLAO
MKALVLENFGEKYTLSDIKKPSIEKGEVLVKIKASGINPLDLKIKEGQAAHAQVSLPAIPGIDLAGIVEAVGEGVANFKIGDEVYGMTGGVGGVQGSLAEYAAVDADLLALKPKNLSFKEAAALPLIFITAWEGLIDRANVNAGHNVLIQGGAGGVGHIASQIAIAKGANVFAAVSPAHIELIKKYGATPIDYTISTPDDYILEHTNGEGFDIIYDTVGGAALDNSFKAAKQYKGHVISILGWGNHSLAPLSFRGATYSGVFTLYPLISGKNRKEHGQILKEATQLVEAGKVIPIVDAKNYTFETIEEAYNAITNGTAKGKVVITIE